MRLYRTGDRARYLPDGSIEFLGRIDQQVKLRGFRVEPGEVEALLRQHPDVREAAVLTREDTPGLARLVAYVVLRTEGRGLSGADSSVLSPQSSVLNELRGFLKTRLPEYMVPSAFVMLEALPLTPNGKLDRRALPAPDMVSARQAGSYVMPRDSLELQLAQIWEGLLKLHPVGVTDNFFDLGGHSLLAVGLTAQIQQQFGRNLPLAALFQEPTIEQLAVRLREPDGSPSWSPLVPIHRSGTNPPFFCVHPAGGAVLCYADLARYLGPDQPFYGLQARGLETDHERFTRVEDMAACYVEALRTVQPHGPYRLGGWSAGGTVVFEMAQQLCRHGEDVALLAILDTTAPLVGAADAPPSDADLIVGILGEQRLPIPEEQFRRLDPDEQINCLLEAAKQANVLTPGSGPEQIRRAVGVFKANALAADRYVPQVYPNQVTLFKTETPAEDADQPEAIGDGQVPDQTMGWSALSAQPVVICSVPGTHVTMIREPYVRTLAERLRGYLQALQPAGGRSRLVEP